MSILGNVNEPTHSTQFSFDESLVSPHFASPSLTNHASNQSNKSLSSNSDVVEALQIMQNGCFTIVLKLPNNSNTIRDEFIDWHHTRLTPDNQFIDYGHNNKLAVNDIKKVSRLHQASAARVQNALNIAGVEQIGLQSVTLRLTMETTDEFNYFLIFDEYRSAFIWNRGIRTVLHLNSLKQPITTIAFCSAPNDRINNEEMHEKMKLSGEDHSLLWVSQIADKLPSITSHIRRCLQFAEISCILDSSEHLSLLLAAKSLNEMSSEAEKLCSLPIYQLKKAKSDLSRLRELWLSLLADLTVAMLKEHQLRNDMQLSTKNEVSISK